MANTSREDRVRRLIAVVDLDPDLYLDPVRAPLRAARDAAAAELAALLLPCWQAAQGERDRAGGAARRAGIARSVFLRLQHGVPEVAQACPPGPLGRPRKTPTKGPNHAL